jgi:hypothetical protein
LTGAAIFEETPGYYTLELFLVTPLLTPFQVALDAHLGIWGGRIRLTVTGRFRFLGGPGLGSDISVQGHTAGKVGLFVKDAQGGAYALTCAHVLDASTGTSVTIGELSGKLQYRVALDVTQPNLVDGALASIASAPPNVSPAGKPITAFANYKDGDSVLEAITGGRMGTIRSTVASIRVPYQAAGSDVVFDDVILITTGNMSLFAQQGDSGSLVVTDSANEAVGLVFAAPEIFLGGVPVGIAPEVSVVVCDLRKTLSALEQQMPTELLPLTFA